MASDFVLAEDLRQLASDVWRIGDGVRHDPEAVYLAKDSIAKRLEALARQIERRRS